ncbi:aKG-HExxH-type peptide beta-hydroxylase [Actinoplanes sp. NPDC049668]|uniref:aKG-HExxH-type peptide beta-hydroxylase n=1 Tax=unclassified Actinoplanes TaxID=2626549 RepID=UPI0033BDA008
MEDAHGRRYYVGWRDDPGPLSGLLQGLYAFAGVTDFWRVHRERSGALTQFEFALWHRQTLGTAGVLGPRPTSTWSVAGPRGQVGLPGLGLTLGRADDPARRALLGRTEPLLATARAGADPVAAAEWLGRQLPQDALGTPRPEGWRVT